jgi:PEP-CTERM/exosortase A-associated glycosyltransferase
MRVLHVLDHSIPLQSGYTFRTRAILREQRRLGWKTFHLTGPKHQAAADGEEEVDGLRFYRTAWSPGRLTRYPGLQELAQMRATARRLDQLVRLVKPDVLHAHSPVLNALPALWVGRKHSIPVIYEVRAFWEDAAVDHGTSTEWGLRYRATRALESFALKHADHVTTICEGLRRDIVARGIPANKVTVIPNAVDLAGFPFSAAPDEALKAQLGLAGMTVVGFIGSFYAYEGLDLLVEALPLVIGKRPDVRLLLVGGGPQEQALKRLVQHHGLQDSVVFTGRVPHGEVQRYYSIVDVLAYPRHLMRLTDIVTPLKPLEAMAQGRLVVASDVGGHRELIRDGETGVLFKAGSAEQLAAAIVGLANHPERSATVRASARRFVEQERNWPGSVARYRPILEQLTGRAA